MWSNSCQCFRIACSSESGQPPAIPACCGSVKLGGGPSAGTRNQIRREDSASTGAFSQNKHVCSRSGPDSELSGDSSSSPVVLLEECCATLRVSKLFAIVASTNRKGRDLQGYTLVNSTLPSGSRSSFSQGLLSTCLVLHTAVCSLMLSP